MVALLTVLREIKTDSFNFLFDPKTHHCFNNQCDDCGSNHVHHDSNEHGFELFHD